jgi:hypothetical protein
MHSHWVHKFEGTEAWQLCECECLLFILLLHLQAWWDNFLMNLIGYSLLLCCLDTNLTLYPIVQSRDFGLNFSIVSTGSSCSPRDCTSTNMLATSNQRATRITLGQTFSKCINTFCLITRMSGSEQIEKLTATQNKCQMKIKFYLCLLSMCWSFWCSMRTFTEWFQWNFISELRQVKFPKGHCRL